MERYGINEQMSEFRVWGGSRGPVFPYRLQCHTCGFERADDSDSSPRCPKCGGHSWERFASPGSLLTNNDQYNSNATL
jgi:hypothetical protein